MSNVPIHSDGKEIPKEILPSFTYIKIALKSRYDLEGRRIALFEIDVF